MCRHLFVYGTLLPELAPIGFEYELASLRSIGEGTMKGLLYDLGEYPGAIPNPDIDTLIHGRVYDITRVDPGFLARLDAYEGYRRHDPGGSLFVRTAAKVYLRDQSGVACWVYRYNQDVSRARLIPHGDYLKWREERGDAPS